jgi:hypothetical protein
VSEETERALRWERARQRHEGVLSAAGMVPFRAGRRLRYACLIPVGPLARLVTGVVLLGYLIWQQSDGGLRTRDVIEALLLALAFLVLCTNRASVTEAGLSFDVAGLRKVSSFGFVPLYAVREVVAGRRPADWGRGPSHGAPFPGLGRVHIRYEDASGTEKTRSAWVRGPQRYAETVQEGRPGKKAKGRPKR